MNKLIFGDNLQILKTLDSESVDLIYIDPPFFSNRNYEVIWGDEGEVRSFKDRWAGGMDHYIGWLKERVEELHRVLKITGSLYLHCDWHADSYIRVGILDKIFGMGNFRNEIIWNYSGWNGQLNNTFNKRHDNIYFYSKDKNVIFNGYNEQYSSPEEYVKNRKQKLLIDEEGKKYVLSDGGKGTRIKRYIDEAMAYGKPVSDVWSLDKINNSSKERIGYPTQKPKALLERIIKASSNKGDVVLDAFVGGGTTIAVADRLERKWIGIDQSVQAIKVTEGRLKKQQNLFSTPFVVQGFKYDYDILRYKDAFEFENWIVEQFGGTANAKQRSDMGLDGKKDGVPIQVKRSDNIGRNVIDNFAAATKRFFGAGYNARLNDKITDGYIIAFSFGKGAYQEVARLKNEEGLIVELVEVEKIVPIAKKPKLEIVFEAMDLNEKHERFIKFTANSQSEAELYQWDFNYDQKEGFKAWILRDLTGVQTEKFLAGEHIIACKVIDKEGLETIENVALKINGVVKKV